MYDFVADAGLDGGQIEVIIVVNIWNCYVLIVEWVCDKCWSLIAALVAFQCD